MMSPNEFKFLKICQENAYFKAGSKVLVALSGGRDSMTLFNWLYDLREKLSIELAVAHVNHKVRTESEDEARYLEKEMSELRIPFFLAEFKGDFTETSARDFRYDFFEKVMRENDFQTLVTAHHQGDQAETVFMRAITGRRLRHLSGIAERQSFADAELVRPLLSFKKTDLDAEIFFEDYTNHENEHLRNRIRNIYLPELEKENPQIQSALVDLSKEILRSQRLISQKISELSILSERIDLGKFLSQSDDMQYFILQEYLGFFKDFQVNKGQFEDLLKIIRRPQQFDGKIMKNYYFVKTAGEFYLTQTEDQAEIEILTENPNDSSFLMVCLAEDAKYELRRRQTGDFFQFKGVSKSLKKFFIDEKVDLRKREMMVLAVNSEVYAIPALSLTSDLSNIFKSATIKQTVWLKVKTA